MQVLHLHTFINIACGISRVIYQITASNEACGAHHIITCGGDNLEKFRSSGIKISVVSAREGHIIDFFRIIIFITKYCRQNNIRIIHSHHRYFDLAAYVVSKILKVSTITSVHSKVRGKKLLSYKADYLIAVGDSIKRHLTDYFKVNSEKIIVINNFILPADYINNCKTDLKNKLNLEIDTVLLAFIGRLSFEKGIDVLVHAFKEIAQRNKKIALLIIGDGEAKDWLVNYLNANKLPAILIPPVRDIAEYYGISDIIILPSRVDPFPLVMIEAGFFGKAFIGSKVDGIEEFIQDKVNGILIEPDDENAIAEAVELLSSDKDMRIELGNKLYKKVVDGYTSEILINKYFNLYRMAENDCSK